MEKINVNLALIDKDKVERWKARAAAKKPRPWPLNAWIEVAADAMEASEATSEASS